MGKNRIQSLYQEGSNGYDDDDKAIVKSELSCLPQLNDLNLQGNPICEHKDYHSQVLKCASNITYLDNVSILPKASDDKSSFLSYVASTMPMSDNSPAPGEDDESESILHGVELSSYDCDFVVFMKKWKEYVHEMIIHEKDDDTRRNIQSIHNEATIIAKTFCQEMMKQNDQDDDESQLEINLESNINNLTEELLSKHQDIKMSLKDKDMTSLTSEIENNEIFIRATDKMMDNELKYIQEVDSMEKIARSTLEASFADILSKIGEIETIDKKQHQLRQFGSTIEADRNANKQSLQHIPQMDDSFRQQAIEMKDAIQHQITLCINKSYFQHGERINEISRTTWIDY